MSDLTLEELRALPTDSVARGGGGGGISLDELRELPTEQLSSAQLPQQNSLDAIRQQARAEEAASLQSQEMSVLDRLGHASQSVLGQGLAFGYGDEISAAVQAPFSDKTYPELQAEIEGRHQGFQDVMPKASIAGELVGGIAPAIATMGKSSPSTVARIAPLVGKVLAPAAKAAPAAKSLYALNAPAKNASAVGKVIHASKVGGAQGFLHNTGRAAPGEWIEKGLEGFGYGAAGGAVLSSGLQAFSSAAKSQPVQRQLHALIEALDNERGGTLNLGPNAKMDAADAVFTSRARNASPQELRAAQAQLQRSLQEGSEQFIPEVIPDASLRRSAKFIANYEPSMADSQQLISKRAVGAADRTQKILDQVDDKISPQDAGAGLKQVAEEKLATAKDRMFKWGKQAYGEARKNLPEVKTPKLKKVMQTETVSNAVERVKTEWSDFIPDNASDNSFDVLQLTKEALDDEVDQLYRAGSSKLAAKKAAVRDKFVDAVDEAFEESLGSTHKTARRGWRRFKNVIEELEGTKGKRSQKPKKGLLKGIISVDDTKAEAAVDELMKLNPDQITRLRRSLGKKGEPQFRGAIRGWLQKNFDDITDKATLDTADNARRIAQNPMKALKLDKPKVREKMAAALGDEWDDVYRQLQIEERNWLGTLEYHPGSSTAGNQAERELMGDAMKVADAASGGKSGLIKGAWDKAKQTALSPNEDTARSLALRYFDTQEGLNMLDRTLPYMERAARNRAGIDAAQREVIRQGARVADKTPSLVEALKGKE